MGSCCCHTWMEKYVDFVFFVLFFRPEAVYRRAGSRGRLTSDFYDTWCLFWGSRVRADSDRHRNGKIKKSHEIVGQLLITAPCVRFLYQPVSTVPRCFHYTLALATRTMNQTTPRCRHELPLFTHAQHKRAHTSTNKNKNTRTYPRTQIHTQRI